MCRSATVSRFNRDGDRETERDGKRKRGRDREGERDTKHLCSCANDSQDHNRLPVPKSKQALSRRLQVQHPQKTCSTVRLCGPCFKTGRTRSEKKTRACELVHYKRCSKWPPMEPSGFSAVNLGARAGLKHRAQRSSCRARHSIERDMSSELCRRSTLRVCRGVSVTAVSISARTSLARRRFSGRDSSDAPRRRSLIFALMLSSDQSGRNARISRGFRPSTSETRNNRSRTRMTHQQQQHEQQRRPAATTQQQQ